MKVLIVGGVAGGATAAARLRRLNEFCEIILFERGEHISYANCGLPYYIGGVIEDSGQLILQTPESFKARFNIDVRVNSEVFSINPASKTVEVKRVDNGETYSESYDYLIISTGAYPIFPDIKGADSERVFTLRSIADTFRIKDFIDRNKPRRAAVIGGGYIGVEVAENLHKSGLEVTIIEKANQVIASIDCDMAAQVHRHIEKMGVRLLLESTVHAITDDKGELRIAVDSDEITADMAVMAVGALPDTALAKRAGLKLNQRGSIIVDRYMRTSVRIFMRSGMLSRLPILLRAANIHSTCRPANKQGGLRPTIYAVLRANIRGLRELHPQGFDLTVAATGINEKTAKKLGIDYDKSFTFSPSHASYYPGASTMTMKVLFEKRSGKILGAQIIGHEGVDKRCDVIATAIRFGATAHDLTKLELCYAPPYSSAKDPVNIAGYAIENILQGRVKHYHWHDVDSLPRDGSVTLLDTRTGSEYQKGHIDGFINIPLDRLREHLRELDKSKPVYVLCQIGLRGYIACRMLTQHGFDCYNLSGGYRLYQSIFGRSAVHQNEMINPETQLPKDLPDNGKNDK